VTRRENYLRFLRRQDPVDIPDSRRDVNQLGMWALNERGPMDPENPMINEGVDWFGVTWKYVPEAGAPMVDPDVPAVLEDICDWREVVKFPNLDEVDFKAIAKLELAQPNYDPDKLNYVVLPYGCFERLHALMGMENACCALLEEPEECAAFFERVMDYKIDLLTRLLDAYPIDVVEFSDDWGHQRSTFFSLDVLRTLIKPQMKRIAAFCDERDIPLLLHSCGKVETFIPDIIDMGIKHWTSCQCVNDVEGIIRKYGDKITCTGGMDLFKAMRVTDEERDRIIRERIDTLCPGGAFIPFGSGSVPGLPEAVIKAVEERPGFFLDEKNKVLPR